MALPTVECPDCLIHLKKYTSCTLANLDRIFYKCPNYGKKGACKTFFWDNECNDVYEDFGLKVDVREALMKMKLNMDRLQVIVKGVLAVTVVTCVLVFLNFIIVMLKYKYYFVMKCLFRDDMF